MERRGLSVRLRMLNNAVRRYLDRHSRKREVDNLTCSNAWIIGYVSDSGGSVFQRELENEFGVTRSTASKVLILLEKKGLIRREGVSHDARLKKITLTEKAQEIADTMREDNIIMEQKLLQGFSDSELEVLYGFLDRIQNNIDNAAKE